MKTFLSIGSGPGNGLATALRFADEGFRVILSARDAEATEELAASLRGRGYEAEARPVDAGQDASVEKLVRDVEDDFGSIDVLHYNAASLRQEGISDQPSESFNADLAVNIGGALSAVKAVQGGMIARGSGTILMTGGGLALQPDPKSLSLSIGKAGIRAMALGLFPELQEKGVHIASLTIMAEIKPGSEEASEVGKHFWQLHAQPAGEWEAEATYKA